MKSIKPDKLATVKHVKSNRGTALSIYHISQVALDLSRKADGTIGDGLEENFAKAFDLLTLYERKLYEVQENEP